MTFEELRKKNLERCVLWHGERGVNDWSLSEWMTALVGEVGEAADMIKKINRDNNNLVGNRISRKDLEDNLRKELADIMIYLDLLAARNGVDLGEVVVEKFNEVSDRNGFDIKIGQGE